MRRSLVGFVVVSLAACGGGGGGGGSTSTAPSGTIGGQAFTPAETVAVVTGTSTCPIPGGGGATFSAKAFALRFGDFTGECTDLESDALCKLKANARTITIVFADVGATASPTLGAGTFTLTTDPTSLTSAELHTDPADPLAGTLSLAFGGSVATTATCPANTVGQVAQGTLKVTSVSATGITGSVDLTFGTLNGSTFVPGTDKLKGDFKATTMCTPISDVCSLAATGGACTGVPTCD